ncbi:MAG: hypothetical protein CMI01_09360 [Oceanospirillaceae bacterium]|uniref:hypothetical protein n=1 Tax=Marinobacterium litorale TaxID=404770 RepID=UPI0004116B5F|nr:hypothetical protein [Marinobacterium litorale]MBS98870.1 hypothetical protein [Oceanospirillaceae bacterium]
MAESSNFEFLRERDPICVQLASAAERSFACDPNTTFIKLRQLGEAFAQNLTAERCEQNAELIGGENSAEAMLAGIQANGRKKTIA